MSGFTQHLMCEHCWYATPGNVLYDTLSQPEAAFPPLLKRRVKGAGIHVCCLCGTPTAFGISFEEDGEDLACIHGTDGSLRPVTALYKRRLAGWAAEPQEDPLEGCYGPAGERG